MLPVFNLLRASFIYNKLQNLNQMNYKGKLSALPILAAGIFAILFSGCNNKRTSNSEILDHRQLSTQYFGEDTEWYLENIPFFECSDKQIQDIYYYRWKLYKAHIRDIGNKEFVITEFIDDVPWDREVYSSIIAAAGHQINEGRWLRDNRYLDGYINYMYRHGGNDRHYSEAIAGASYARYLANADTAFITSQLDGMKQIYEAWNDHFDPIKNLYYIKPTNDATEYSIASLDASGGADGWGGEAFRPTVNSYMEANAQAISNIAALKGDQKLSRLFAQKAATLKTNIQNLWNDSLQYYSDRYKVDNKYVHSWDFIKGRELAGLVPWMYNIPDNQPPYFSAWKVVTDTTSLLGKYGLRTVEPSCKYYMKQYRINPDDCQWNGPSWPYQTCQVLTAAANLLNNYTQDVISTEDYLKILRLYAAQHYLPNGKADLQEDYNPDTGKPIVGLPRSHHYLHSTYNDLIITGMCGIRPSEGNTLNIHPLVDNSIKYFCLSDVQYHGHKLTLVYDADGSKYKIGKGLTVFVDDKKASLNENHGKYEVEIGAPIVNYVPEVQENFALNIRKSGFPTPSASVNSTPDSLYQAIDGRIWYFPEVKNHWSTVGSTSTTDWYALDFGQPREISSVKIYLYADGKFYGAPESFSIEYFEGNEWKPVVETDRKPKEPLENTVNTVAFDKVSTNQIRINFKHKPKGLAVDVAEVECY